MVRTALASSQPEAANPTMDRVAERIARFEVVDLAQPAEMLVPGANG
jgi:hypothetical protein